MPRRGRKPRPTAAKEAAGNPGRRPLNEDEPKFTVKAPPCPRFLDREARKEWGRVAKLLVRKGVITDVDRAVLIAYCESWSLHVEAQRHVQEDGHMLTSEKTGQEYHSPWLNVLTASLKSMVAYAAELGMTPSSRTRVQATPPAAGKPGVVAGQLRIMG